MADFILFLIEIMDQLRSHFHPSSGHHTISTRQHYSRLNAFCVEQSKKKARKHPQHVHALHDGDLNTRKEQNWRPVKSGEWVPRGKPQEKRENAASATSAFEAASEPVVYLVLKLGSSHLWRFTKTIILLLLKHTMGFT